MPAPTAVAPAVPPARDNAGGAAAADSATVGTGACSGGGSQAGPSGGQVAQSKKITQAKSEGATSKVGMGAGLGVGLGLGLGLGLVVREVGAFDRVKFNSWTRCL